MKRKAFWLMLFIIVLGTALRLIFINKPDGLWNDEYLSWMIASIPFGQKFTEAVVAQCHMPFYYLYLKFFITFWGNSDLVLRLTSVLTGVLSIPAMYFLGKEYRDEKLGFLCASFTALSSFLIYFSQEVRFYSVLFLFTCLGLIFTIKLIKKQSAFNFIFYFFFNFLIIFTHTIGFIYVAINMMLVSFSLCKNKDYKKIILAFWGLIFSVGLIALPFLFMFANHHPLSQWWGHFSLAKIGFLFTDYFSPILTNLVSSPDNFFYNFSLLFLIFAIIPTVIAIVGIVKSLILEKGKDVSRFPFCISPIALFVVSLAFLVVLVIFAVTGKLLFITKYSIEVYPTLILLAAYGLLKFEKNWRTILIFLFCFLNLFYVLVSTKSAPKLHRSEGHKIVAQLLKNAQLNKGDFVILNYYPKDRFEKYFDFKNYSVLSVNKGNYSDYLGDNFEYRYRAEVLNKLKPHQKVALVVLNDVAMYSNAQIYMIFHSPEKIKQTPALFLAFSQIKNSFMDESLKDLRIVRLEQKGSWSVITFSKK